MVIKLQNQNQWISIFVFFFVNLKIYTSFNYLELPRVCGIPQAYPRPSFVIYLSFAQMYETFFKQTIFTFGSKALRNRIWKTSIILSNPKEYFFQIKLFEFIKKKVKK